MEPNFHHLQLVMIEKRSQNISAGDVVVFRKNGIRGVVIKRVVACPGDTVLIKNGLLFVNGMTESDPASLIEEPGRAEKAIVLGMGKYFVLGDNVNHSIDSRFKEISDVDTEEILGKVITWN